MLLDLQTLRTETEALRALEQLRADLASFQRATRCEIQPHARGRRAMPKSADDQRLCDRTFVVDPDAVGPAHERHVQLALPDLA